MASRNNKKKNFVIILQLVIATTFILASKPSNPQWQIFYSSYFIDIFLPFGFYFLLSLNENRFPTLKKWWIKSGLVFALCATSEFLQFFGIFALARVFDPLDLIMYGVGVLMAGLIDKKVLRLFFPFWG